MGHVARNRLLSRTLFGHAPLGKALRALLVAAMIVPSVGCVRRRLNVRTNPPGALVYVDNQQIGTTPCSVDFTYYGTREIRLVKPGYETLTVNQPIPTPWYQYPGLDFISENLVAMKIRDNRTVTYNMSPQVIVPTPELVDRANQLRQNALQNALPSPVIQAGAVVPAAPGRPIGPPPGVVPAPAPMMIPGPTPAAPGPAPAAFPAPGAPPAPTFAPSSSVPQRLPAIPASVKDPELLPPPK